MSSDNEVLRVHPDLKKHNEMYSTPRVYKVTNHVYVAVGYALANMIMIEGIVWFQIIRHLTYFEYTKLLPLNVLWIYSTDIGYRHLKKLFTTLNTHFWCSQSTAVSVSVYCTSSGRLLSEPWRSIYTRLLLLM